MRGLIAHAEESLLLSNLARSVSSYVTELTGLQGILVSLQRIKSTKNYHLTHVLLCTLDGI